MAGEMAILDPGYCFRGGCGRCGNGSARLYDTEVDVEFEPAIALCGGCITDLARRAGVLGGCASACAPKPALVGAAKRAHEAKVARESE